MRPKAELVLSDVEREQLLRWSRRAKSAQAFGVAVEDCAGVCGAEGEQ